jgi:hypothetical protein
MHLKFNAVIIIACWLTIPAIAQIPRTISYQGVLTDAKGNPRPDGSYDLTFALYVDSTGGTKLWQETKSLAVNKGMFSTFLGDMIAISLSFDRQYYLGIAVGRTGQEFSQRIRLSAAAYAFGAVSADSAAKAAVAYRVIGSGSGVQADTMKAAVLMARDTNGVKLLSASGVGLRVDKNGKVGIGTYSTASTDYMLDIKGTIPSIRLNTGDAGVIPLTIQANNTRPADTLNPYIRTGGGGSLSINSSKANDQYGKLLLNNEVNSDVIIADGGGSVGIGTTTPIGTLHIRNTFAYNGNDNENEVNSLVLYGSAGSQNGKHFGGITWTDGGRKRAGISSVMENDDADFVGLAFWTKGTDGSGPMYESVRITHAGDVGIGTTAPEAPLHVVGNIRQNDGTGLLWGGTTNSIWGYNSVNTIGFTTNGSESMRIMSGNVGIGTTNPGTNKLYVNGNIYSPSDIAATGSNISDKTVWRQIYSVPAATYVPIQLYKDTTTLQNGYGYRVQLITVGTGTNTGTVYLIYQTAPNAWAATKISSSLGEVSNIPLLRISGNQVEIFHNHASIYRINTFVEGIYTGNVNIHSPSVWGPEYAMTAIGDKIGIGTTTPCSKLQVKGTITADEAVVVNASCTSDRRFKTILAPITSALDKIKRLSGVLFTWKRAEFPDRNFPEGTQIGLIAQDVEKVLPELVHTADDGYKSLSYDKLTAVLVEAVKEQQAMIDSLRTEVASMKVQLGLK